MILSKRIFGFGIKFWIIYPLMLILMLSISSTLEEIFNISSRLAILLVFLSLILIPAVLFIALFLSLILTEIFYKLVWNIKYKYLTFTTENQIVSAPISSKLFNLVCFFYSTKTQEEIFQPIVADWQEEYFEALFKKDIWKARWINVRYTISFLLTMWIKSPIGDLIDFFTKGAK